LITAVSEKRGNRVRGLVEYLFGPGRSDEHTDQHVVAAYADILVGDRGDTELGRAMLATELDMPRRAFAPEVTEKFVYHVSISNPTTDRDLTDEEWRDVADTSAARLGFNDGGDGAAVRWIAVRHGKSSGGNDHIHLVANLIREDGRKHFFTRPDFTVLAEVRRGMEAKYGLTSTAPAKAGTPELSRPEVERQRATGMESDREALRRGIRAAATASRTESEFVDAASGHGMILRPRWARGGRREVVGYSVARPTTGTDTATLVWFGGGKLGRDLTLPALRAGWTPDPDAAKAWQRVGGTTRSGPRRLPLADPRLMAQANQAMTEVHERLAEVSLDDRQAWSALARDGAGVLAAMAQDMPDHRVKLPLTQAAHALASAAWREPRRHIERPPDSGGLWKAARAVLTVGGAQAEVYGTLILVTQLMQLAQAISDKHEAAGRLEQARWAAQAAERGLAAMEVIRASPGRVWAAQLEPAAKNRTRRTAAELAREFDAGPSSTTPTTGLPPRTRRGSDREPHRDDREYGR
jgi:hypothetical protein